MRAWWFAVFWECFWLCCRIGSHPKLTKRSPDDVQDRGQEKEL